MDALTGERRVLRADIIYDCGYSINPAIDMGQVGVVGVEGVRMISFLKIVEGQQLIWRQQQCRRQKITPWRGSFKLQANPQ